MKSVSYGAAAALACVIAAPAAASTVVDGSCISVTDSAGCLFSGNINSTANGNQNSFLSAQNAYNTYNNTHPSANPDILLNVIASSNDSNFGTFGSITGAGTSAGTWTLNGYDVDFVAVKASSNFVLYKLPTALSSFNWDTLDIPYKNNPHALSHLVFFGTKQVTTAVPEPASWAMMIGGFGLVGGAMRRRKSTKLSFA